MGRLLATFILSLCIGGLAAHAREVILAQDSHFVSDYKNLVASLQPGDRVTMNGRSFTLGPFLGSGVASQVWSIGQGRALRLPKSMNHVVCHELLSFRDGEEVPPLMKNDWAIMAQSYAKAATELEQVGAPVVRFFPEESQVPFFTIVERLAIEMSAKSWFENGDVGDPEMQRDWQNFLMEMDFIDAIGDLKLDSIAYVRGRGWILIDFADPIQLRHVPDGKDHSNVYSRLKQLEHEQLEIRKFRSTKSKD